VLQEDVLLLWDKGTPDALAGDDQLHDLGRSIPDVQSQHVHPTFYLLNPAKEGLHFSSKATDRDHRRTAFS
jgi:hypothetical protein